MARKNFTNPAKQFISNISEEEKTSMNKQNIKLTREPTVETRSKRVQLLIQPSLHKTLKKEAENYNVSVNELINSVLINTFQSE